MFEKHEIGSEVKRQIDRLARDYAEYISLCEAAMNDGAALCMTMLHVSAIAGLGGSTRGPGILWALITYYLLIGDFKMAWYLITYAEGGWAHPYVLQRKQPLIIDRPEFYDLRQYFATYRADHTQLCWGGGYMPVLLLNEEGVADKANYYNTRGHYRMEILTLDEYLDRWLVVEETSEDTYKYDISREARYRSLGKMKKYYLSYESFYEALGVFQALITLDRDEDAREILFRVEHILATGEPPSHLMEHSRIKHNLPQYYTMRWHLQARQERDIPRRRLAAWTSVYWLLETFFRTVKTDIGFYSIVRPLLQLIAEFDLMEERQTEFLRYCKLAAMQSSKGVCERLYRDPTPLVKPSEMDVLSTDECIDRYPGISAEEAARFNEEREKARSKK
jgi:hypothetical protein